MMKKLFKLLVKLSAGLLILPLLLLLYCWISNLWFMGGVDPKNTDYLSQSKWTIDKQLISNGEEMAIFDNAFYDNQVFLLGENHGYADVQLIDKYMLLHLNRKIGLRYYLAEMDSLRASQLNAFLKNNTKDSVLLKQIVSDIRLRIPQQSSKELFRKWMDIYDYNQSLPDSLKITVIGVDKDFEDESREIGRDSLMMINFKNIVAAKGLEKEKFYGFFGFTHVLQSGYGDREIYPFAAKIKRSQLPFADKIQSIVCYTLESEMYIPRNEQFPTPDDEKTGMFNLDGPFVLTKGIKDLKEVTNSHTITLFHLNKADSPYRTHQKLAGIKVNLFGDNILPSKEAQYTTDFFQYVILIRNSSALSKLDAAE